LTPDTPGLRKKGDIWHIQKVIAGKLVRQSTGETELEQAERYLAKITEQERKVKIYDERLERTFNEAEARYINEYSHKTSLDRETYKFSNIMPYIGAMVLKNIYFGVFDTFISNRRKAGITAFFSAPRIVSNS